MKPNYRPGKPATSGKVARARIANSKPLSEEQMGHLHQKKPSASFSRKAGRGGKRAGWESDYEQGRLAAERPMPNRENERVSQDGVRKFGKKGH